MSDENYPSVLLVGLLGALLILAQDNNPNGKVMSPPLTPVILGQEMFRAYCASCHGPEARGDGPAARALTTKPSDLTHLSQKYGGKFPTERVESVIRGDQFVLAHGSREMPIWGEAFRRTNRDPTLVNIKVRNLTAYIESLQQK